MGELFRGAVNAGIRDPIPSIGVGGGQGADDDRPRMGFAATAKPASRPVPPMKLKARLWS